MGEDRDVAKHKKTKRSRTAVKRGKTELSKGALRKHGFLQMRRSSHQEHGRTDYQEYRFSWKERLRMATEYLALSGGFAYLFYRSWMVFVMLWVFYPIYLRRKKQQMIRKRQDLLCRQFKDSIQCAASSMAAGYSIENAFREAYAEMRLQYGPDALITGELRYMNSCLSLNLPLEQLLYDFANRSGLEDVRSFCEVFTFAKRSGGDFIKIIHMTADRISEKNELMEAIRTEIAGKRMEQKLMNLMPLFILLYVDFSFGGYLDGLYHNTFGILVMTVCLGLYIGAYLLSEKIMSIQI